LKDYIHERVVAAAKYVMDTKSTVRETAKVFGVSKSTIHKDITDRLPRINPSLAEEVKRVLAYNKAERHIRGGKATREKYIKAQGKSAIPS
jgi:putative DeoR family transcriptional regulator (stage III sporulation protein D)